MFPSKTKYKYHFEMVPKGNAQRGFVPVGEFALKALEPGRITTRQIEACRSAIRREMKRAGQLVIRIFPHFPISGKPSEVRMGSGKGAVNKWVAKVRPGTIIFEVSGVEESIARKSLKLASDKLGIKTTFVARGRFSTYKIDPS
ncbi:50S ribosomal protein L16 [Candidatus Nesciobacter abundans]|uniref:50S ribosomal protein L16 n=1 Tax=Candidatus Nesciobacter abundans TaxID=2601668 RepID=A0A5C0UFS6_9PROT|nr:50S ribosomal protein L16 [Candidatus Nesciobacter abundans]QEK38908.1 50S ribosomal protein L16 [Candidatus Nesciobacter abundans]